MRLYELVLVLKPSLHEKDREKFVKTVQSWLKDVKCTKEEALGSKALAYKIKKELTGFYYTLMLETEKVIAPDFEKKLLTNENVLRHLLMRTK